MYNIDLFSKSSFTKKSCAFFPVVVFLRNTHTRPKTHTAGRKETIKSLFSSSPPVFLLHFHSENAQSLHSVAFNWKWISLRAVQDVADVSSSHSKGFTLIIKQEVTHWSVLSWCLFAESLPLSLDTYMKRCFIQTATFFFFHFYLCKTLSWKHLWVLSTGSLQEVREMAVECNCVDCLLITSFRLKRSPVQKNLGDLLDINKH